MPGVQKPHCSALRSMKALLQIGDLAAVADAFDGLDPGAVALHRQHQAAAHHHAVDAHGAGAADAVLAADMAAGEPSVVAQEIDQRLARIDALAHLLAVHREGDVVETFAHPRTSANWRPRAATARRRDDTFTAADRLQVVGRVQIGRQRRDGGVEVACRQRRLRPARADRRRRHAEIGEADIRKAFAVGAGAGGEPGDGVVAVPACEFGEADAGPGVARRGCERR